MFWQNRSVHVEQKASTYTVFAKSKAFQKKCDGFLFFALCHAAFILCQSLAKLPECKLTATHFSKQKADCQLLVQQR